MLLFASAPASGMLPLASGMREICSQPKCFRLSFRPASACFRHAGKNKEFTFCFHLSFRYASGCFRPAGKMTICSHEPLKRHTLENSIHGPPRDKM